MNRAPFILAASALSLLPASADLSWEYADQRRQQAEEARSHQEKIEQIQERERARQPSPKEQEAYAKLGKALGEHPEMMAVNEAESAATADLAKAHQGGNEFEISLASQKLAKAKAERFQKAASIPELLALITAWQKAALTAPTEEEAAQIEENGKSIGEKLGGLLEQLKR